MKTQERPFLTARTIFAGVVALAAALTFVVGAMSAAKPDPKKMALGVRDVSSVGVENNDCLSPDTHDSQYVSASSANYWIPAKRQKAWGYVRGYASKILDSDGPDEFQCPDSEIDSEVFVYKTAAGAKKALVANVKAAIHERSLQHVEIDTGPGMRNRYPFRFGTGVTYSWECNHDGWEVFWQRGRVVAYLSNGDGPYRGETVALAKLQDRRMRNNS